MPRELTHAEVRPIRNARPDPQRADVAAVEAGVGYPQGLAAAPGLLGGSARHRSRQRGLRVPRRPGAGSLRLAPVPGTAGPCGHAAPAARGVRPVGLARPHLLPEFSRQRHPAGDRRAASRGRRRPRRPPVAPHRGGQDRPHPPRPSVRRLHRPRGSDRPGRRVDHAGGRALRRHGPGARADPGRIGGRHRGGLQHAARGHRLRDRGDGTRLRGPHQRSRPLGRGAGRSRLAGPHRELHLFRRERCRRRVRCGTGCS